MTPKPRKCALYARVSKSDESQNPENQLAKLRRYVKEKNWAADDEHVYVDRASGADKNRPELDRMLRDARAHRFSIIIVTKVDRLARSARNLLNIMGDMENHGVQICCLDQPEMSSNTASGNLLRTVLAAIAEFERELVRDRTKAALVRAKADGVRLGRPRLVIDVDRLRSMKAEGRGVRSIARELGVSHQTVRNRLRQYVKKRKG